MVNVNPTMSFGLVRLGTARVKASVQLPCMPGLKLVSEEEENEELWRSKQEAAASLSSLKV